MSASLKNKILDVASYTTVAENSSGEPVFKLKEFSYDNVVTIESQNPQGKKDKVTEVLKERLMCSWSLERAVKDKQDRERLVTKANDLAKNPAKVMDKRGAKKYLKPLVEEASKYSVDQAKIDADASWDGIYGIQTSDLDLSQDEVMDAYKNLWRIEEIFRTLKSTLEMRPMFHWTPDRIKGHMVACFISFVFERTIELAVEEQCNHHLSSQAIREAIYSMQMSKLLTEQKQTLLVRAQITPAAEKILAAMKVQPPKAAQLQT
jgi:transposase